MATLTTRFPDDISYGSSGGPRYNTTAVMVKSGFEKRNANWSAPLISFDVAYGVKTEAQLDALINYFNAAQGRLHDFPFKDFNDFSTNPGGTPTFSDVNIGTGDAVETQFQVNKTYTIGGQTTTRKITNTVSADLLVGVNAVEMFDPGDYSISSTGLITFVVAPGSSEPVTWGGTFDVLVRFDSDELSIEIEAFELGTASVSVVEVRR